ncbi:MAG: beta-N-acetylglucosaminidase domain-containing protein [Ignavibacteria bacterium]|jgi:hypothetical protein
MKFSEKIIFLLLLGIINLHAQNDPAQPAPVNERLSAEKIKSIWVENEVAEIYPIPVKANYTGEYCNLYDDNANPVAAILVNDKNSKKAAAVLNNQLSKFNYPALPVYASIPGDENNYKIIIKIPDNSKELKQYGEQAYQIKFTGKEKIVIELSGGSERGELYAVASLAQLICRIDNKIKIRKAQILDYPAFTRRIFNSKPMPYHLTEDLDWMLRYKIESLSFHNKDYSWYGADEELEQNLKIYKDWKDKYGGVNALLIFNLYAGDYDIEITNKEHQKKVKEFIEFSYLNGVTRFMINADDTPPFKYGEGYILTSENDKKMFSTMAEAHCWLMNDIYDWAKSNQYEIEFIYCPSFYTYEEMHYGDMDLFKDTPWEDDAYGPLKNDLKTLGEKMNKDIEIIWTGPYVCTRTLTDEDIAEWTDNLQGRAPFLFDNSIFSQFEYTARTMFIAYGNDFPVNFSQKTGGNGIFINGDAVGETSRAATMTANAYMWEEERYNPEVSLINAMRNLYGSSNLNMLFKYKDVELELCKVIKQRELWFAADELWESIRNTRFITEKNPFHYHQNYGRFKALRLQLKNSVPEPGDFNAFKNKCIELNNKREKLLAEIENKSFKKLNITLQSEMIKLPSFDETK